MAQSDMDFIKEYGKDEQKPAASCPHCGQPTPAPQPKQPSTLPDARRAFDSGSYPRPRLGGMTVR